MATDVPTQSDELADRTVLVTGASSGIGAAVARRCAAAGAEVVLAARRVDRLTVLAAELAELGARAHVRALDVTDPQACRDVVASAVAETGRLDVLVNNAGVMLLGPVEESDPAEWDRMVATNLLGLMHLSHAALPHLLESRGTLVQMSSIAGRASMPGAAAYCATKHAVGAFSESLRLEVTARGVRVVLVEPGTAETELRTHITHGATRTAIDARAAAMRQLRARDVADAVHYAVTAPAHVSVSEVLLRPTDQA